MVLGLLFPLLLIVFGMRGAVGKRVFFLVVGVSIAIVALYLLLSFDWFQELVGQRFAGLSNGLLGSGAVDDESIQEREVMREFGLGLFQSRPILGYGVHGFAYEFLGYYGELLYSHSGYVELLSCYGIVGFILFYWIFAYCVRRWRVASNGYANLRVFIGLFLAITLLTEKYTMAFITPQVVVLMVVGMNFLAKPASYERLTIDEYSRAAS